jgi:hypothetical protein
VGGFKRASPSVIVRMSASFKLLAIGEINQPAFDYVIKLVITMSMTHDEQLLAPHSGYIQ